VRKRFAFDIGKAIPEAWRVLWANNLKTRAEEGSSMYRPSSTYYLTASAVESQVRRFAEATAEGKSWSEAGIAYGRGYESSIRFPRNLNGAVRDWLREEVYQGRLASHNFGRHHISGMRFRPAGEPISDAETTTMKAKAARKDKPRPRHFGKNFRPTCVKPKNGFSWRPSKARVTTDKAKVTCPRCLKLLKGTEENG
jgi:hypothetical protein